MHPPAMQVSDTAAAANITQPSPSKENEALNGLDTTACRRRRRRLTMDLRRSEIGIPVTLSRPWFFVAPNDRKQ